MTKLSMSFHCNREMVAAMSNDPLLMNRDILTAVI